MISFKSTCSFQLFNQLVRRISSKSLAAINISNKIPKKILNETAIAKKKVKKPKKKSLISKRTQNDDESHWLESLNADNLKLYRKTSIGKDLTKHNPSLTEFIDRQIIRSFRVIQTQNLLNKLKMIYPELIEKFQLKLKSSDSPEPICLGPPEKEKEEVKDSSPQISEFVLKNLLSFPLFKKTEENFILDKVNEAADVKKFPSVTKILFKTMSDANKKKLEKWEENMIQLLGVEGFLEIKKNSLKKGSKLHGCLKQYLESKDESQVVIDAEIEGCWNSVKHLLPYISEVKMLEKAVHHPILKYKGIVDCIASYKDVPCVIEWKKSEKKKTTLAATYDAPIQLCAYLGAVSWPKQMPNLQNGLVVVVYTDGSPASVFQLDLKACEFHWNLWLQRLHSYWECKNRDLIQSNTIEI